MDSIQAASKRLEADIQTRLAEHSRLENLIQEHDAQHQQWQFDAISQLQQVEMIVSLRGYLRFLLLQAEAHLEQQQRAFSAVEAPLQRVEELQKLQEEHASLMAKIEQRVSDTLEQAASGRKAGEVVWVIW